MPETLRDREILLVGGAGGIGSAVTGMLAAEGARLTVTFRASRERAGKWASVARITQADITLTEDRRRLLDSADGIYGLVVFAGDPARLHPDSDLEEVMTRSHVVNFLGPILLARAAAGRMKASGAAGAIVLVSSMQAVALFPGSTAYAAPKAALLHAARILAKECRGPANIRVNVVSPGVTAAGMAEASIAAGKYDRYLHEQIIPRFGRAEDVARAVRFFLEPDNYITGQALVVDGGLTL